MEEKARNEQVDYHHPLLRYKIWDIVISPSEAWNPWHYHKEVEVLLLSEGSMQVETVDTVYEMNGRDLLIIGASRLHRTKRTQAVKQIVLQFDMSAQLEPFTKDYAPVLLELSEPLDRLNRILNMNPDVKAKIYGLLMAIYEESSRKEAGFELTISGAFKQLIALMIRHLPLTGRISSADWLRLQPVLDYVDGHYKEPIRIQDVLPFVHLEYHYFIKYFQQHIGMSFVDYLHLRRIKVSERLLLTKPFSIADIGLQSGFPNVTQFIRIFKRYNGCTPSEFRKKRLQLPQGGPDESSSSDE
ncbi:helix-turn-helix domain-containing protein [Paenibacillus sp. NPDC056579]|uniref:AraC family transcriptional regulator n=1 Tax=Paenibacillus sp. NPDC056579 TaxID=3345871 RepID=UPI0036A70ED6